MSCVGRRCGSDLARSLGTSICYGCGPKKQKKKNKKTKQNRNPRIKSQQSTVFDKGAKNTQWGKDSLCQQMCCRENCRNTSRTMRMDAYLTSFTKINFKWIKGIRCDAIKLLGELLDTVLAVIL